MSLNTIWFFLAAAVGLYLAVGLLLFVFQAHLLYYPNLPSRTLVATPGQAGLAYEPVEIIAEDGVRLEGWFLPAEGPARGTLLFFHGNAGNISHRLDSLKIFVALGLDVLIFDYRGYGRSKSSPSESGTYLDAAAAWRYLIDQRGSDPQDIVLFGRSLGAAIAAQLAAHQSPGALILESGFTSVPDLAAQFYRIYPVRWLSRFRYSTKDALAQVDCPVLVVHSRDDEIIPFGHGQALFAAARDPKAFLELRGGHNDGFLVTGRRYVDGMDDFLTQYIDQKP